MGRKLDALLGRHRFKSSQFKATASLAVSRLAVLKNQRQARCSIARSDVVELLKTNNHQRAILRVEQVIKEQNMLDVFVVLEGYCHLLIERVHSFEHEKVCPDELIEAVSSLIYAATRCGEFPELQELRGIFTSRFGKEFAARAVELRNNCGVNPKVIQKLSTRMPSLENKKMVLKQIASDNNIDLAIQEEESLSMEMKEDSSRRRGNESADEESMETTPRTRRKYKDVADAAQAAFESAAYAAEAARAAVELSRSESADSSRRPPHPPPPKFDDEEATPSSEMKFDGDSSELLKRKKTFSSSSSDDDSELDAKINQGNTSVIFDKSDDEMSNRAEFQRKLMEEETEGVTLNINRRPMSVRRTTWAQRRS